MFDFLKRHKKEDVESIRSHVLGRQIDDSERWMPKEMEPPRPAYAPDFEEPEEIELEPPRTSRPAIRRELEPMSIEEDYTKEPLNLREPERMGEKVSGSIFDILEKLKFIEAQLSAIKSQNETINEKLKNIEMRIGRRY